MRSGTLTAVAAGAVGGSVATFVVFLALGRLPAHHPTDSGAEDGAADHRAAMVHEMGTHVMPFSLEKTTHVFEMTERGGVQDVVVKDVADSTQIPLIRQHLAHEAMQFGQGDFGDPGSLHGADMPGLKELAAAAGRLKVSYEDLPNGGRIRYETDDPSLVTAVHRWFGAQLSDHGADATYR